MDSADHPITATLAEAAAAAGYAPSVHNTQPWRWRVTPDVLDLFAVRERQLPATDPQGRLLIVSCGAALHYARIALSAQGWSATVTRLPDPADPDHLARLTCARTEVTPQAMRLFQTASLRRTDRRPVSDTAVDAAAIDEIRRTVHAADMELHVLTTDQLLDLAAAASYANTVETDDEQQRAELAYWIGGDRPAGTGIPDAAIPRSAPETTVPGRDFVRAGTLAVGPGHDRAAMYAVLYGPGDEPADWLRAGEALSAGWLTAIERGLTVLPFSSVIELPSTRETLRRTISHLGHPYLVLRIGIADPDAAGPPHTPRLPAAQTIDLAPAT